MKTLDLFEAKLSRKEQVNQRGPRMPGAWILASQLAKQRVSRYTASETDIWKQLEKTEYRGTSLEDHLRNIRPEVIHLVEAEVRQIVSKVDELWKQQHGDSGE